MNAAQRRERARTALSTVFVTDSGRAQVELCDAVHGALTGGVAAVMLRERDIGGEQLAELARTFAAGCEDSGALFLVNHHVELARDLAVDGVHLGFRSIPPQAARVMVGERALVGRSTHDLDELARAIAAGVDYVTFGPVYDTPSKRGLLEPCGLTRLAEAVAAAREVPVLALGGVTAARVRELRRTGCAGVAFIGAVYERPDPQAAARDLVDAWASAA